ncbi:MAG: amino acid ABC transporter substrate-binding protein [Succinivibrio sp.]|nr:amino acid ABC transporter substrate-binding protein [Succinivibrio sp.]
MNIRKFLFGTLFSAGLALYAGLCQAIALSDDEVAFSKPDRLTLLVGTDPTYPPYEFKDENDHLVGFDIDLINAMAEAGGFSVEFHLYNYRDLIDAIKSFKIDAAISGLAITKERLAEVDFSDAYYDDGICIMVHYLQEGKIHSSADLVDRTVCVHDGSFSQELAQGMLRVTVKSYPSLRDVFKAFDHNECVAVIEDKSVVLYAVKTGWSPDGVILDDMLTRSQNGIMVAKNNQQITKLLQESFETIKKNGTYQTIIERWFR